MKYHHFKNIFFNSNTFIIENKIKEIVVVDPGNPDVTPLINLIKKNNWLLKAVILTHEHADHIAGLPALYEFKKFPVYCSQITAKNISNCRENFSKYIEEIDAFELNIETTVLSDNEYFSLINNDFLFIETPGHSPGGGCVFTSDAVFTGDTFMGKNKAPVNFPHSDKSHYDISVAKIKSRLSQGMTIFPGHGNPFEYK